MQSMHGNIEDHPVWSVTYFIIIGCSNLRIDILTFP